MKTKTELQQDVCTLNMEVEQLKAQIVALGEQASLPDGSQLIELLERVRFTADEAKLHGNGAVYWNNAVFMCQIALRDELAAAPQPVAQQKAVMPEQESNFTASNGEYRNPAYQGQFEGETPEQAEYRRHWAQAAIEVTTARLNGGKP